MKQHNLTTDIRRNVQKLLIVAGSLLATGCVSAQQSKSTFTADDHTIMLLQPKADGTVADAKHAFTARVNGATTVTDADLGQVLQFGEGGDGVNGIRVNDSGKLDFSKGLTLEMKIKVQQPDEKTPNPGGILFSKLRSFDVSLKSNNKIHVMWNLPVVTVATSTDKQYKWYPVEHGFYNDRGGSPIPTNRWVDIALTYDPVMKVARSFIDGKLNWTVHYPNEEAMQLLKDDTKDLTFLQGMKNVSVGEIRVSNTARAIETLNPFETYAHALPYRKKSAVIFDHIYPSALPLDVVLQSGEKKLQTFSLTDPKTKTVFFDAPVSEGQYTLSIKATSKGKEVYSRNVDLYAGDDTKQPIKIDDKNRFVVNGKPVFPLVIYHTFMEDVPQLAKMGFTHFIPRSPNSPTIVLPTRYDSHIATNKQTLEVAKANDILMIASNGIFSAGGGSTEVNKKGVEALTNHPALGAWMGSDEPTEARIAELQPGYTAVKQIGTRPIFGLTAHTYDMQMLAETADILASDPYPLPNISLRSVADYTRYSVAATDGLKPVWTVLGQYAYPGQDKRPTVEELRCMAYLAIASGANGLGIYAWDDRDAKTFEGWRTGDHPEDVKILETVIGELNALQNVLIIPNSTRALTFAPNNPALHAALKESGTDNYLMVVSDSRQAEKATLSIDGVQSADGVDVHDPIAKLSIRNGKVEVQLPPLGVRLYKLANVQKN